MKIFLRILIVLALLVLMTALFALYFVNRSKPVTKGEVQSALMTEAAEVYYDAYGIPHIYAAGRKDAYRALGYVHAQDRLFQMELLRRAGTGTLSEVLGPDMIEADSFFRTLGTGRQAEKDAAAFHLLPARIRNKTEAYIEGVNAFIAEDRLPLEFTLAGIEPRPFTVKDMCATAGYMAYSFAYALRTDPVVEHMALNLGEAYLNDLDMAFAENDTARIPVFAESEKPEPKLWPAFLDKLPVPSLQGSNAWAVAPSRSASGGALLANDTHIKYASPSVWYEAHLNYPGGELYGNFMAGIPFALIGHTRTHAWGVTMFEDDDSDFFIQEFAAQDSSATRFGEGQTKPVTKHRETIRVKGEADRVMTVYETDNGPIINEFLPAEYPAPVAMYWNYTCIENTLFEAFDEMAEAGDMAAFRAGAAKIGSPGLNITYADAAGNIATMACSKLIRRPAHTDGKTFARGFAPEDAYLGFYDFSENPGVVNPPDGIVVSANQFHKNEDGIDYPGYYAPNDRYDRLHRMAAGEEQVDMAVMKRWVTDVVSDVQAKTGRTLVAAVGDSAEIMTAREKLFAEKVRDWDGNHGTDAEAPVIYYKWLYHVLDMAMRDELGDDLFESFLTTHLLTRSYPGLAANSASKWWDNIHTDEAETRAEIVFAAFRKAVAELGREHPDPENVRWGEVHTLEHAHPLGRVAALRPFFNVGPFPAPGGTETVNNSGFRFNPDGKYPALYGPAMRILIDLSDPEGGESVLPTGNSGNLTSDRYRDQAEMYVNGEFRPMLMNEDDIRRSGERLVIRP